jgi:hypothetical protein
MPSGASTPWPATRQPRWAQRGVSACIAHSKLSHVCVLPPGVICMGLS